MQKVFIIGICFFTIVIAGAFYFLQDKQVGTAPDTPAIATTTPEAAGARTVPDGRREYRNTAYHFSLLYPETLEVKEYIEGGNALTVTFQDTKRGEGFQIFITPYAEQQISDERFKKDVPSGVRTALTDITVDGATGAAFYSESAVLGETREVWFIHNGRLFEVTSPRPLNAWLASIVQTWEFL